MHGFVSVFVTVFRNFLKFLTCCHKSSKTFRSAKFAPLITRLEITHIKYRQPLCGLKCVITVFHSKYNVCTTKICLLLGKYIFSTNMNSFIKVNYSFPSKTWAGRPPELAGILCVKFRVVLLKKLPI